MSEFNFSALVRFGAAMVLGAAVTASAWAQSSHDPRGRAQARAEGVYQPEVVGGRIAKPGRWPFMVAILDKQTASHREAQWCGGTLISKRDVLTAGHCVFPGEEGLFDVLVGKQTWPAVAVALPWPVSPSMATLGAWVKEQIAVP